MILACGGSGPKPPTKRLCEPGQSSDEWMQSRLADEGAQAVFDELELGTPLVWCTSKGTEEHGDLRWVLVQKLEVDGDRIVRGTTWLEQGQMPRMNPKAEHWRVDRVTGPEPVTILLGVERTD